MGRKLSELVRLARRIVAAACAALALLATPALAQAAGGGKTTRIIVAPIRGADADLSAVMKEALRARIEDALAATKVFTIETRLEGEADLIFEEGAYIQKAAPKVDLIVFPEVDAITARREAQPIARMEGRYRLEVKGDATMRVRVISAKTAVLRRSFTLRESIENSLGVIGADETQAGALPGSNRGRTNMAATDREFLDLADKLAVALTERVYDDAYPPQIIKVMADRVFISRGERGGFKPGDVFTVYNQTGEVLRHPVTGEVLEVLSLDVGRVRIIEAQADYSVGELVETKSQVREGALVRR